MRSDKFQARARQLCEELGIDPDSRIPHPHAKEKTWPAWCSFRERAIAEDHERKAAELAKIVANDQEARYRDSPLTVMGYHDEATIQQMKNCMKIGNVVAGVLCADGHLGYAQPVGGVIAYEDQISVSGVGFDIACGNMAVKLDTPYTAIKDHVGSLLRNIVNRISFGVGRVNAERVDHELFDKNELWASSGMEHYRRKAQDQLGTVGSGNHYVDLMVDEGGLVWIGVHFGSRGLGHTSATQYLKLAGGKDGMHVPPTVLNVKSELGQRYLSAMELAGQYAYAGREWVVEQVRAMIGGTVLHSVHNHHNYAWQEIHEGRTLWVVRKGATPAFPGQQGFVGGSMGDNAVILEGLPVNAGTLRSTVHGAGRVFGRNEAKRRFSREQMDQWIIERGVRLIGGDLDESPMAYRRLGEVLQYHAADVKVVNILKPFAVAMASPHTRDPFKD